IPTPTLRLVRSLRSRAKPKKSLPFLPSAGGLGGAAKIERIFWFCFAASSSEMSAVILTL
ncbi:MAG: hypothetical protein Q8R30_05100, partial [bacterium]|nr:hypothetical protein [bacterium]